MGNFDIGLAMVAARIASSEIETEQAIKEKRKQEPPDRVPGSGPKKRTTSLPGAVLEVMNGKLILIPSAEPTRVKQARGWTLTREDGSVVHIDTGEIVRPPEREQKPISSKK